MKNLLSEELERYRTLSNYNAKFTLTENTGIISENIILNERAGIEKAVAEAAFSALGKDLAAMIKTSRLPKGQTLESLLLMSDESLKKEFAKAMNTDLKGGVMQTSKEISKIMAVREITRLQTPLSALTPPQILTVQQVDDIIYKFKNLNDAKFAKLQLTKGGGRKTAPGPGGNKNRNKAGGVAAANPGLVARIKAGMSWPTLLKVGAGIATVGVLWWLFTDNSPLPHPPPQPPEPPEPPQPPPPPPPRPDSKYKTCPDTFPIEMYCKNETVRKVQGCLSIKTDGAFGPGTQTALVAKGLPGTEITQNTVDVACGSNVVEPVVDPNVDLIDGEDPMNI